MMARLILLLLVLMFGSASVAQEPTFELNGVSFPESTYLAEAELRTVTDPYMNRPITFTDVQSMLAEVQLLYTSAGVVTAQVMLPPQDVADGILRLDLVEATNRRCGN